MDNPTGFGLVNESNFIADTDLAKMAAALEIQLQRDFCPAYNLPVLPVQAFDPTDKIPAGYWYLHFTDAVTDQGALGYHTDEAGNILAEIEIAVLQKYGCGVLATTGSGGPDSVSSVASHELMEMIYDPEVNLWAPTVTPIDGTSQASEVADPVQENYYSINGVQLSNFVLPPYWLTSPPAGSKFDFMGVLTGPFTIAPGGYAVVADSSGNSKQVFGSRPPSKMKMEMMRHRKKTRLQGMKKTK